MADVAGPGSAVADEHSPAPLSRKGMRTRARLVDAAKKVFERDGFLEARIVDIAETAQIAPGDFDDAVEQLTILWGNALGLEHPTGRTTK